MIESVILFANLDALSPGFSRSFENQIPGTLAHALLKPISFSSQIQNSINLGLR